ncbi:MAG: hypothetical protein DRJ65_23155, partial [Acidobacteria bacterium]
HLMFNAWTDKLDFQLPPVGQDQRGGWRRLIDTFLASPEDISSPGLEPPVQSGSYTVSPKSLTLLIAPF